MSKAEGIRFTEYELRLMALFEQITGIPAKDCIVDEQLNRLIFVVGRGLAPFAVGKNGVKIRLLKNAFKKDVEVIEYGQDVKEALRNSLYPANVVEVNIRSDKNRKTAIVKVPAEQVGMAVGRMGRNIRRAKLVARRYFGINDVRIVPA